MAFKKARFNTARISWSLFLGSALRKKPSQGHAGPDHSDKRDGRADPNVENKRGSFHGGLAAAPGLRVIEENPRNSNN